MQSERDGHTLYRWLTDGWLQAETEATTMAAQDQVILTRVHTSGDVMCHVCGDEDSGMCPLGILCLQVGLFKTRLEVLGHSDKEVQN